MARFEQAIITVLKHEGGFVDDPDDPGGATNFGISLRFLRKTGDLEVGDIDQDGDIDADDIRQMDVEDAKNIYRKYWWDKYGYARIGSQVLATKIFDLAVNMGAKQAHKLVQRACRAAGVYLIDDGVLGNRSYGAIITLGEAGSYDAILAALRSEAASFYKLLIAKKPVFEKYRNGWLNRAYA